MIDARLAARLYDKARCARWRVAHTDFTAALEASAAKGLADAARPRDLERYLSSLHLEDLALACACAAGDEEAWGHFVLEHRPQLYRAADAIDPTGSARDLADSLYAELFGLGQRVVERQSLFKYFHGRSSLATWLRAVLAQRHVDRMRAAKRIEPLPEDDSPAALAMPERDADPERQRYVSLMHNALTVAMALLSSRDRLRLACYYAQEMTLAQTGRLIGEHEATVSRQLARTRKVIKASVEKQLRSEHELSEQEVSECFASIAADTGPIDLADFLGNDVVRKKAAQDRSIEGTES